MVVCACPTEQPTFASSHVPTNRPSHLLIFVPSHLRVLNVSREIMLFSRSLIENLRFGTATEVDGTMGRITRICRKLKVSELLFQHIILQDVHGWSQCLSESEVQIVGITRAMIANPEFMCIHKPTQLFGEEYGMLVHGVKREFIDERGLCCPMVDFASCRPRTAYRP